MKRVIIKLGILLSFACIIPLTSVAKNGKYEAEEKRNEAEEKKQEVEDLIKQLEEEKADTEAYILALEECVRRIPREMVIHRLTGDGAKRDLLAPLWSGDKKRVLNAIHQAFARDDVEQGSAL